MEELDLKQLTGILWRKKFTILFIILIFTVMGLIYTFNFVEPMYKSTCTIILGKVTSSSSVLQDFTTFQDSEMISQSDLTLNSSLIETYSELVKSKSLIEEVRDTLNLQIPEEEIMKSISVSRVNNSDLLEVTATSRNPKVAKEIVKNVVDIFSQNVKEIYNISNVYVIDDADIDYTPYNINHVRDTLIFALVGLFISAGYILLYNIIDNTVKGSYDIENVLKSKILMTIPLDKRNKKEELITVKDSKSVVSETFRTLRTNVQFSSINSRGCKTLLVTSCLPEEGKSYISANLAITFAQAGKKVILVDSDMRRGRQARMFNVPNYNGLSNYISNLDSNGMELNWPVGKFIKETNINNLNIITAGNIPPNPSELLESERVSELIEELKKYYEVVIFDGPPILPIADSLILARLLGNTMLVAVYNKTKRDYLQKAKNSIENVGGKIIGVTLNKTTETSADYSGTYYYYGREEGKKEDFLHKLKRIFENKLKNSINKIKSLHKRIAEKSSVEVTKVKEIKTVNKANADKIIEQEDLIIKEELAREQEQREEKKIALAEKAKKEAELAVERAKEEAAMAEEKARLEQIEKQKKEEVRAKREEENRLKAEKRAEEERIKNEKKAEEERVKAEKRAEEERIKAEQKAEAERIKEEENKKKKEEQEVRRKQNEEKRKARRKEFSNRMYKLREKALIKKDEILESFTFKRQELSKKYADYKVKKEEDNKLKKEQNEAIRQEIEKAREEERARREAERAKLLKEREEKEAELARIAEAERVKKEAEEKLLAEQRIKEEAELAERKAKQEEKEAEERAKREAELAIIREQERVKREEEKAKREQERAEREAERLRKEEELKKQKEEERMKKDQEKAKLQEIKAARGLAIAKQREEEKKQKEEAKLKKAEEAKYTDEYLEENLYPKTKFNKF